MSKLILVIDSQKNCYKCPLNNYHFCNATGNCIVEYMNKNCRPDWCPLKAVPEKYDNASADDSPYYHMSIGWNSCIDDILSEN